MLLCRAMAELAEYPAVVVRYIEETGVSCVSEREAEALIRSPRRCTDDTSKRCADGAAVRNDEVASRSPADHTFERAHHTSLDSPCALALTFARPSGGYELVERVQVVGQRVDVYSGGQGAWGARDDDGGVGSEG